MEILHHAYKRYEKDIKIGKATVKKRENMNHHRLEKKQ